MEEAGGGAVVDAFAEEEVVEEMADITVDAEKDDKAVAGRTERMELTDVVAGGLEEDDKSAESVLGLRAEDADEAADTESVVGLRDDDVDEVVDAERLEETGGAGGGDEDDGAEETPRARRNPSASGWRTPMSRPRVGNRRSGS